MPPRMNPLRVGGAVPSTVSGMLRLLEGWRAMWLTTPRRNQLERANERSAGDVALLTDFPAQIRRAPRLRSLGLNVSLQPDARTNENPTQDCESSEWAGMRPSASHLTTRRPVAPAEGPRQNRVLVGMPDLNATRHANRFAAKEHTSLLQSVYPISQAPTDSVGTPEWRGTRALVQSSAPKRGDCDDKD